jgi:hypothetical protein
MANTHVRIYPLIFALAAAVSAAIAYVDSSVGIHSTPGIWIMLLGLPGTIIGVWATLSSTHNVIFYAVASIVNWGFYVAVFEVVIFFKRHLRKRTTSTHNS